jgi:hypothetical protein
MNVPILARRGCFGTALRRDDRLFKVSRRSLSPAIGRNPGNGLPEKHHAKAQRNEDEC